MWGSFSCSLFCQVEGSLKATCCLKIGLQRITIVDLRCNKNVTPVKENQGTVFLVIGSRLLSGEGGDFWLVGF